MNKFTQLILVLHFLNILINDSKILNGIEIEIKHDLGILLAIIILFIEVLLAAIALSVPVQIFLRGLGFMMALG